MAARFDAFISYSRRASATLATDLQSSVERFAKPWYRLRAVRVFRDDASMSANTALWSNIEKGLSEAEWLVLLASPLAANSQYVAKEVAWWREHKSADRIIIVLEEGVDIRWDAQAGDFDWTVTDSLPRALSGAFAEEPRWIDLRWYESSGSLGRADPRWEERVADVAAAVRFTDRDVLIGENVREHRRAQRYLRAGIAGLSLLLVASLVATYVAVGQRSEAQRQTRVAVEQREEATKQARIALARQLAAQAVSLAPTDLQTASLLAVQAYRTNSDAQTRAALFQLATSSPRLVRPLPVGAPVLASAVTPDGLVVTGDQAGNVLLWDGPQSTPVAALQRPVISVAVSDDGRTVAAADESSVTLWSGGTATTLTDLPNARFVEVDATGTYLAASDDRTATAVWSLTGGSAQLLGTVPASGSQLAFGDLGLSIFGTSGAEWYVVDPAVPAVVASGQHGVGLIGMTAVSGDGGTFAQLSGSVDVAVWNDEAAFSNARPNAVAHTNLASGLALAVSSDGSLVATQGDGRVEVASVQRPRTAAERPTVLDGAGPLVPGNGSALAFGGDRYLLSATGDTALLWDLTQFNRFGTSIPAPVPEGCTACGAGRIAVSPDGSRAVLWALGSFGAGPVVVELATGAVTRLDPELSLGLESLAWDGSDRLVGYASAEDGLVSVPLDGSPPTVVAPLGLGSDGDAVVDVAVGSGVAHVVARSGVLLAVDLATGTTERSEVLAADERAADAFHWRFSPDASSLYVATIDLATGEDVVIAVDVAGDRIEFAGPGSGAAYDGDSRLHVFDGETVATLVDGALTDPAPAPGVAADPPPVLSPEADVVVTGGQASDLRLLDLAREGATFGTVAVAQQDRTLPASAFTPDGSTLVTAFPAVDSLDLPSSVRTLSLDPDDWITAACAVGARDLTEADWARYGVGPAPNDLRCVQ